MVAFRQVVLSILASSSGVRIPDAPQRHSAKSFVIVGAGSAGLAMLKTLAEFPSARNGEWDLALLEQRRDVGGIWLPEAVRVFPPQLPETPLYPFLRTNTPVPSMTYPGFPFREGTPLYPSHEHIQQYHSSFAHQNNLTTFIHFNNSVLAASWTGNASVGQWNITYQNQFGRTNHRLADHLVIATGNNHYPHIPHWRGEVDWLRHEPAHRPRRKLIHSVWYREPEQYANLSVLIVGYRASGSDAVKQITPLAKRVYLSIRSPPDETTRPIPEQVKILPAISHFTNLGIHFVDGQVLDDIDAVILATGYEARVPFLERGHTIVTDPTAHSNETYNAGLVTNLRYIFPLHQHIFSLCPTYPPTALAFIGLPIFTPNCASDIAQSLFATHAMINPDLLPSREGMLRELAVYEEDLRNHGQDPYQVGHRQLNGSSFHYMDSIVQHLKDRGALPKDGKPFVEPWRRAFVNYTYLKRGWERVEELGAQDQWLKGVETEDQWAGLMGRLNEWQRKWEERLSF